MDNEPPHLRAGRGDAAPRRVAAIHPEALTDIDDGYFHLLVNLDEGWSLGLIAADSARAEEQPLVRQAARAGADILRLEPCHLLTLRRSKDLGAKQRWVGAEVRCTSGNRYFLMVLPVENDDYFGYDNKD